MVIDLIIQQNTFSCNTDYQKKHNYVAFNIELKVATKLHKRENSKPSKTIDYEQTTQKLFQCWIKKMFVRYSCYFFTKNIHEHICIVILNIVKQCI